MPIWWGFFYQYWKQSCCLMLYTEQNYKRNTFVFSSFFMSWTQRSKTFSMYTKGLFLSILLKICLNLCWWLLLFAETIHPPHMCGTSRCWLDSVIIAQAYLRLATIKGHSKMCSFITQHNVTDVTSFEGVCNCHADSKEFKRTVFIWKIIFVTTWRSLLWLFLN